MSDKYTHIQLHFILFFASHGRLSPQISFCDPHPTVFIAFSFFLWIQTGFEEKAAFVPSRFVHLPTNLPASTYNLSMTLKKILTDTPLEIKMTHMRSCKNDAYAIASWIHSYFYNVMTKFMINNRTDACKTDVNLLNR